MRTRCVPRAPGQRTRMLSPSCTEATSHCKVCWAAEGEAIEKNRAEKHAVNQMRMGALKGCEGECLPIYDGCTWMCRRRTPAADRRPAILQPGRRTQCCPAFPVGPGRSATRRSHCRETGWSVPASRHEWVVHPPG